jgi:hypothetical protein
MNREDELNKQFPLEDGTTYIQSIDKANEPKGAGVGGESIKENFIDSASLSVDMASNSDTNEKLNTIYEKLDRDYMYNWIKGHKNR